MNNRYAEKNEQKKIRSRVAKTPKVSKALGGRKSDVRDEPERESRRALGEARGVSQIARLVHAIRAKGIRFQIAGMSAAILQGVPATTIDTDIWVELPSREFVRLTAIVMDLGGIMLAPTVAALEDDTLVNFLPRVDGIGGFDEEIKKAKRIRWQGMIVPVLPLESLLKSKQAIRRPKDLAHIPLLQQTLRIQKKRSAVAKVPAKTPGKK